MGGIDLPGETPGSTVALGVFILVACALAAQACSGGHVFTCRGVIDRFEETVGVILVGVDEVVLDVPRRYLPVTASEGDIIWISLDLCEVETEGLLRSARQRLSDLTRPEGAPASPTSYQ